MRLVRLLECFIYTYRLVGPTHLRLAVRRNNVAACRNNATTLPSSKSIDQLSDARRDLHVHTRKAIAYS
jgi:hypothetical protein